MTPASSVNSALNRMKRTWPFSLLADALSPGAKARLRRFVDGLTRPTSKQRLLREVAQTNDLLALLLYENALASPRAHDPKRLLGHGFKVYSQHDEDGIITEIMRRVGATSRFFVEFGVGDGLENCTTYLLLNGWSGAWIDGSAECYEGIQRHFRFLLDSGRLRARYSFITAENIESLFAELGVPEEFDLLSIDIDRNDYWVWRAVVRYRPRVVAIEYNASFKQSVSCVVPYDAGAIWDGTNYYGSSLKALESLGAQKGYRLVGCNYTGVTAFFVREDLVQDRFCEPFSSENHYEPPRYVVRMPNGHAPAFGPMISVPSE